MHKKNKTNLIQSYITKPIIIRAALLVCLLDCGQLVLAENFNDSGLIATNLTAQRHHHNFPSQTVITNLDKALAVKGTILAQDASTNLAAVYLTSEQIAKISNSQHFQNKCAGFEALNSSEASRIGSLFADLIQTNHKISSSIDVYSQNLVWNAEYQKQIDQVQPDGLKDFVKWLSSYPNRYNKDSEPNRHVEDLKMKIENLMAGSSLNYNIELVSHQSTRQKTLKVTIPGKLHADEIIVLGAHLDSINQSQFGSIGGLAPGADDNASGSGNIFEALKIIQQNPQPERTLQFFWYAGEESGLLGSAEIAKEYKAKNLNVIAVLQLDMTLFPGNGLNKIGLVTDFTSPWLRSLFTEINSLYVKAQLVNDECGYGCSDHASWHRQGFHAMTPFEATTQTMNRNIHTVKDVISTTSDFNHSNVFTKYAILFALVLGNSNVKPAN